MGKGEKKRGEESWEAEQDVEERKLNEMRKEKEVKEKKRVSEGNKKGEMYGKKRGNQRRMQWLKRKEETRVK